MEINYKNYLHSSSEWRAILYNGGSVYCIIKKKHVRTFRKQMLREDRLEKLSRKKGLIWEKIIYNLYLQYESIIRSYLGAIYEDLQPPIFIYETSWHFMKKVEPITIENNLVKIVFYGKDNIKS